MRSRPAEATDAELSRLYCEELMSSVAIAVKYGVPPVTVRYWLKAAGIPRRSKAQAARIRCGPVMPQGTKSNKKPGIRGGLQNYNKELMRLKVSASLKALAQTPERRKALQSYAENGRRVRAAKRAERGLETYFVTECRMCGIAHVKGDGFKGGCCQRCHGYMDRNGGDIEIASLAKTLRELKRTVKNVGSS